MTYGASFSLECHSPPHCGSWVGLGVESWAFPFVFLCVCVKLMQKWPQFLTPAICIPFAVEFCSSPYTPEMGAGLVTRFGQLGMVEVVFCQAQAQASKPWLACWMLRGLWPIHLCHPAYN